MKGFYIKQTERENDYGCKCFDIYDENKKLIKKLECDVIDIELKDIKRGRIMFEIVDDMIHIWTRNADLDVDDLLTSTFYVEYKESETKKEREFNNETKELEEEMEKAYKKAKEHWKNRDEELKKFYKNVEEYRKKAEENSKETKEMRERIKKLYEEVEKLV